MREILFRAKVKKPEGKIILGGLYPDGSWVYGDLHLKTSIPHIHDSPASKQPIDVNTVGQYTGITDCDGNRIFEGDIIDLGNKVPSVVVFDEDAASFYLKPRGLFSQSFNDLYNVIGNIYDNEELIPQEDV